MADLAVSPGPGILKTMQAQVYTQNTKGRMEKKGSWHGHPSERYFLTPSPSDSLGKHKCSLAKILNKQTNKKLHEAAVLWSLSQGINMEIQQT